MYSAYSNAVSEFSKYFYVFPLSTEHALSRGAKGNSVYLPLNIVKLNYEYILFVIMNM